MIKITEVTTQKCIETSFKLNIGQNYAQILESDFSKPQNWKTSPSLSNFKFSGVIMLFSGFSTSAFYMGGEGGRNAPQPNFLTGSTVDTKFGLWAGIHQFFFLKASFGLMALLLWHHGHIFKKWRHLLNDVICGLKFETLSLKLNHKMPKSKWLRLKNVLWRQFVKYGSKMLRFWKVTSGNVKIEKSPFTFKNLNFQELCNCK